MKGIEIKKNLYKIGRILLLIILTAGAGSIISFEIVKEALKVSVNYGREVVMIFPAILLLIGLADVWLPKKLIKEYLGQEAGIKGTVLAVFFGTLPTGPMYVAFPIARELLDYQASLRNVVVFLGVWGALKVPQIGVEIQFLGLKFAFFRFIFTLTALIIMGEIIGRLAKIKREDKKDEVI